MTKKIKLTLLFLLVALIIVFGAVLAMNFAPSKQSDDSSNVKKVKSEEPAKPRPVALVVENAPDARPQWGMDDPKYSPDIILEGEVEGGITRTLWFFNDYNKIPKKIGPMRSARPPFIRFSKMFDAIFVHWGQSNTTSEYVGADTVFKKDKIDHINAMTYTANSLFSRDNTRNVSSEHTGVLNGKNLPRSIKDKKFRKIQKKNATQLKYNKEAKPLSDNTCTKLTLRYSSRASGFDSTWKYDEASGKYKTSDFENNLTRDNLLILFDRTQYIIKSNYKNSGSSVGYCDYKLSGGKGKLLSKGTIIDIKWFVNEKGQLEFYHPEKIKDNDSKEDKDTESNENKPKFKKVPVKLNPGKTWIGWASSNNGGKIIIKKGK